MVLEYKTKVNGKWIYPGEEIPSPVASAVTEVKKPIETDSKPTKSDIQKMPVDELRQLATSMGIEDAENTSGARLKHLIADRL